MKLPIINIKGEVTDKMANLNDDIFSIEPNDHVIYLDVKRYLAHQRQGTHKAKERGEVKGSTKKLRKQKGAGKARVGDIKNPLFRGGGRVFGPRPRIYEINLTKKVKTIARKSALSYKAIESNIKILEDFKFDMPKTKEYITMLSKLMLLDKKTLLVLPESDKNIYLSARNLPRTKVAIATDINTYDILNANTLLISESSLKEIENTLSN